VTKAGDKILTGARDALAHAHGREGGLERFHTKQLMIMRDSLIVLRDKVSRTAEEHPAQDPRIVRSAGPRDVHTIAECRTYGSDHVCWGYPAVKAELGTREHVPNAREAKALRQAKAKAKRHA
jgi:hypothetical protein